MRPYIPYLGLGFYYAWLMVSFYTSSLFPTLQSTADVVNVVWIFGAAGYALSMVLFLLPPVRSLAKVILGYERAFAVASGLVTAVASFGSAVCGVIMVDPALSGIALGASIVCFALSGLSSGMLLMVWGCAYARLSLTEVLALTFSSRIVGVLVYLVFFFLPKGLSPYLVAFMPIVSAVLFMGVGSDLRGKASEAPGWGTADFSRPKRSLRIFVPLAALFLYALGGEVFRMLCIMQQNDSVDTMGLGYNLALLATATVFLAVLACYRARRGEPIELSVLVRPAVFVMAVAFVAFAVLSIPPSLSYAIYGVGFYAISTFSWVIAVDATRRFDLNPLPTIAVASLPQSLAPCMLPVVEPTIRMLGQAEPSNVNMFAMLFACAVFAITLFMVSDRDLKTLWGTVETPDFDAGKAAGAPPKASSGAHEPDGATYSERFAGLAKRYKLTRRETEVAELLARGRNLPYVEETLQVSHGTAQTHQRHIYEKMGVHSRQEFIDAVEHLIDLQ